MPDQLQLRGGTTTEHNSFTGALREVTVDTTKKTVVVHDGSQAGGTPLMRESGSNAASSVQIGSGGANALTIDSSQDITLTGASANVVWDKSDNAFEFADNAKAIFGTGSDLQIYHDGTNSFIDNDSGYLYLNNETSGIRLISGSSWPNGSMAAFYADGAVELYYDNSKKLETNSTGAKVYGSLLVDNILNISPPGNNAVLIKNPQNGIIGFGANNQTNQVIITTAGDLLIPNDTGKMSFGASEDLQIYHDGTHSRVVDTGTGNLILQGSIVNFQNVAGTENMIKATENAEVQLMYNNTTRLQTTANGVEVNGNNSTIFKASCATNSTADILFQNSENGSSGDIRLLLKVGTNQGADPYIKFDAGGSDMIVGNRYNGSTNNYLALGAGNDPSSVAGIHVLGTGIVDLTHTYANTVGGSIRDLYIRSDGRLGYDSSVRASKTNIADLTDISWIDNLIPKTFNKFKQDNSGAFTSENYNELEYGLIAEEVETVNKELCSYSNEGSLEAVHYKKLITPLLKGLQDARKAISTLETKVAALEAA